MQAGQNTRFPRSPRFRPAGGTARWWTLLASGVAVLLVPFCLVSIPPVEDYPNHLARMYLLAFGAHDPVLSRMYAADWHVIPNLAMDVIGPPLLLVLPLDVGGKIVLALALLMPLAGVVALHRAVFRSRSYWPLGACLIAYNGLFLMGFINFLIGLGAALLVAAAWTALRPPRAGLGFAVLAVGAVVVFFCHIVALGLLGLVVACTMAEELFRAGRRSSPLLPATARRVVELVGAFLVPVLLVLVSPFGRAGGVVAYGSAKLKLTELIDPVLNYHPLLDGATALAILLTTALVLLSGRAVRPAPQRARDPAPRRSVLPMRMGLAIAVLLMAFVLAPFQAKGAAWFDSRFPLMAACLVFAGLRPPPLTRRVSGAIGLGLSALFAIRTATLAAVWHEHGQDLAELRRTIASISPGARVLVARVDPLSNPAWWHGQVPLSRRIVGFGEADENLPALLVLDRHAFWPLLFADPSQQPIRVLAPYRALSVPVGVVPSYDLLAEPALTQAQAERFPYLRDWWQHFDDVLILDPDGAPNMGGFLPGRLRLLERSSTADLFRIRHAGPEPGGNPPERR